MSSQFLLREFFELCDGGVCQDLLTEQEKKFVKEGGMILSGKLQEAEVENGNKRIYSEKVLLREIENYKKVVNERRALGELDHPESSVINLQNVSHLVTSIWMEDKSVMGKIKVLDTPAGKTLRSLVSGGASLGISSRGLGTTKDKEGKTYVQDDFQLICFDIVSEPSTPGAYMNLSENKVPVEKIFSKSDRVYRIINEILGKEK
tara:strand:+ start:1022 stop:1636 length:615 start_codon:yes stop_codon:yes gene_type:complete